jgi:uncharacterized protein (TIGR00106 family)
VKARSKAAPAPPATSGLTALDRDRAGSLADEGGAAGASVESQDKVAQARAEARAGDSHGSMLFELSVLPIGGDIHLSDELARVLEVVDRSGLRYQLGPGSTCIEGGWDEAMELIRACHGEARRRSSHVITLIRVEDDEGEHDKIRTNVASVEEKAGHALETCADAEPARSEER